MNTYEWGALALLERLVPVVEGGIGVWIQWQGKGVCAVVTLPMVSVDRVLICWTIGVHLVRGRKLRVVPAGKLEIKPNDFPKEINIISQNHPAIDALARITAVAALNNASSPETRSFKKFAGHLMSPDISAYAHQLLASHGINETHEDFSLMPGSARKGGVTTLGSAIFSAVAERN